MLAVDQVHPMLVRQSSGPPLLLLRFDLRLDSLLFRLSLSLLLKLGQSEVGLLSGSPVRLLVVLPCLDVRTLIHQLFLRRPERS